MNGVVLIGAAGEVDRARIETIHAFCSALLRMHPFEAGLPPDIETLADLAAEIDVRERLPAMVRHLTPPPGAATRCPRLAIGRTSGQAARAVSSRSTNNWDPAPGRDMAHHPLAVTQTARGLAEDLDACIALLPCCRTHDELYHRIDGMRLIADRLRRRAYRGRGDGGGLVSLASAPSTHVGKQGNWSPNDGVNACKTSGHEWSDVRDRTSSSALQDLRSQVLAAIARELRTVVLNLRG